MITSDISQSVTHLGAAERTQVQLSRPPERSLRDVVIVLLLALLAVFWVWPCFLFTRLDYDEGILLQGAVRILQGQVPYRDFFSFYTPAGYYVYAALFKVFGTSIVVARATLIAYAAFFASVTYLLARRAGSRTQSAFAACLLTLICLPSRFAVLHNWDSTVAAVLALYCAVRYLENNSAWRLLLCGFFAGATLMLEQSKGAGLLLGLTIAAAALYRLEPRRHSLHQLFWLSLGTLAPVATVLVYFASHGALLPMLRAWTWPLQHYTSVNRLPYGFLQWLPVRDVLRTSHLLDGGITLLVLLATCVTAALPIVLLGAWSVVLTRLLLRKIELRADARFAVLHGAVLFGVFAATLATGRADFYRLAYMAPLFFFAIPSLADGRLLGIPTLAKLQPFTGSLLGAAFVLCGLLLTTSARQASYRLDTPRGPIRTSAPDSILPYLDAHVAPGAKLLVYPYVPLYSFLSGTLSPTQFEYLQAGMNTPAQFEEARRLLERDPNTPVLFEIDFRDVMPHVWPATPAEVVASDPMGDYIFRHYRPCKTLFGPRGPFEFMVRKGVPCPE
jgi:4-amino-4-deoxy-L-arabinose transferase-like glycosyltransferase